MAKDKETEVTPEVTPANRPGFSTSVTDAPDHNRDDPNAIMPSQRVLEEQAAGRAAVRDGGRVPGIAPGVTNPADADHVRAGELAKEINDAKQARDHEDANPLPPGEIPPGDVPSKGYTYVPPPGEAVEADKEKMDADAKVAEVQEARAKQAQDARSQADKDKDKAQHERDERNKSKR